MPASSALAFAATAAAASAAATQRMTLTPLRKLQAPAVEVAPSSGSAAAAAAATSPARACPVPTVLVLPGSLSPPTLMHLLSMEQARDYLVHVCGRPVCGGFLSPVHDAYGKAGLAPAEHRLRMCELATEDSAWIAVDRWEASQARYSPTHEVMRHLNETLSRQAFGARDAFELFLVCGADLLQSLDDERSWPRDNVRALFAECRLIVVPRPTPAPGERDGIGLCRVARQYAERVMQVPRYIAFSADISSSRVRYHVAVGRSIQYAVPRAVERYIAEHRLYRVVGNGDETAEANAAAEAETETEAKREGDEHRKRRR